MVLSLLYIGTGCATPKESSQSDNVSHSPSYRAFTATRRREMRAFENGMTCLPIASPQHWEETIWGWLNLDTLTGKHGCFGAMRMRKWKWKSRRKRLYYSTTSSFSRRPNLWEDNLSWTEIQCEQSYQQYLCTLNLIASLFVTLYPSKELASVDIRGHLGREGWLNSEMSII